MSGAQAPRAERVYLSLVSEHQTAILNYVYRLVGDADIAEDLTQETYVKAWRALERLELDEEAAARRRAWLYRIAHNTALDHLRRKTRFRWLGLEALRGGGGDPAGQVVDGAPVRQALRSLGEDHRQVLLLFNQEGMTSEEVSEVLGISPAAARKRRQRARDAFRDIYQDLEAGNQQAEERGGEDEDSDGDGDGRGDGRGGDPPAGGSSGSTGNRGRADDAPSDDLASRVEDAERTRGDRGGVSVSCTRLRDRLELGPLGAMGAAERAELEAHAAGCADCRRLLESEVWIDAAFDGGRRLAPSRALQRALLEVPRRDRRARWLAPLALPLAMAFCALAGWGIWTLAPDSEERMETAGTATAAVLGSADATATAAAESEASPVADGLELQRRRETAEVAGTATAGILGGLPPATASVVAATLVAEATEALALPSGSGTPPAAETRLAIAPDPTRRPGASGADPGPRQPQPSGTPEVVPPGIGSATEDPTPPSGATQSLVPTATPTGDARDPALPTETAPATPTEDPGGGRIATGTVRPPTATATPDPELPPVPPPSRTPAGTMPPPVTRTPSAPTAGPAPTDEPTAIATATASVTTTATITPTLTTTPTPGLGPRPEQGRAGRSVGTGGSGGPSLPPGGPASIAWPSEPQERSLGSSRCAAVAPRCSDGLGRPRTQARFEGLRNRAQSRPGRPAPGRA